MSILETFYILFKGDNTDLKKKVTENEKSLQGYTDVITGKFIPAQKAATEINHKVGESFAGLASKVVSFIASSAAAYTVLSKILSTTAFVSNLSTTSASLRVNAAELDAWGQAAALAGGSVESFQSSLQSLADHFGTTGNVALRLLPRLADVFQRIGTYRSQVYGKALGLDQGTILLLQQGRREIESVIRRVKELSEITEKDIEISNKYKLAQFELSLAFRGLYLALAQEVVPVLTKFFNILIPVIEYVKNHKDVVIGAFIGIGIAAGVMLAPFIIARFEFLALFTVISALIGLFAIIYDDIQTFRKGGISVTGDLIERWSKFKNVIQDLHELFLKILKLDLSPLGYIFKNFPSPGAIRDFFGLSGETPIATASSNAFATNMYNRNAAINTGDVIIQTQATTGEGIGQDFINKLIKQTNWQAANYFADGVQS
jgi:hypothetical protein